MLFGKLSEKMEKVFHPYFIHLIVPSPTPLKRSPLLNPFDVLAIISIPITILFFFIVAS